MSTAASFLHRLRPQGPRAGMVPAATRLLVCPPEAWPRPAGLGTRLVRWFTDGAGVRPLSARQTDRLAEARSAFEGAIDDLFTHAADEQRLRIGRARSLRELWHLRAPLFVLLARALGEAEAQHRLDELNRFFPTRAPRSGFAALQE